MRQKPGPAYVGKEADPCLGHCQASPLGHDSMATMGGHPDAAAHGDAVHDSNIRLREILDTRIKDIFLAPEGQSQSGASPAAIIECSDVAARTKAPLALAGDQHRRDLRVKLEIIKRGRYDAHHIERQAVDRFRPVQADATQPPRSFDKDWIIPDICVRCAHLDFLSAPSLNSCRRVPAPQSLA
jgi:hypothetical protein